MHWLWTLRHRMSLWCNKTINMEVELRAKIKNINNLKNKLREMGAIKTGEKLLSDYYFGDIGLYKKIGHSFWIRIRDKGDKIELAYKGSTGKDGVYEEYEQNLQDLNTTIKMLSNMGLDNEITVHKKRESFKLGNISIEIDVFEGWGTYIEAEIINNTGDKKDLFELFRKLEISKEDIFEKGYITLMLEEKNSKYTEWIKN